MKAWHPTTAELETYVLGALQAGPAAALEVHAASCSACAAALAREARFELAFEQVARRGARAQLTRPLRAIAFGAAGLVAAAAVAVLCVGRAPSSRQEAGEGSASALHGPMSDGAIFDTRNDALDGG